MSLKEDDRLFCDESLLISHSDITSGWQWLQKHLKKSDIIDIKGKFYVKSSKAAAHDDLPMKAKELIRSKWNNFEGRTFNGWKAMKSEVFELERKGDSISCTCPLGLKHKFCKHRGGLMIKLKIISVPENLMILPIGKKNKRGRPKKIGGALSYV